MKEILKTYFKILKDIFTNFPNIVNRQIELNKKRNSLIEKEYEEMMKEKEKK